MQLVTSHTESRAERDKCRLSAQLAFSSYTAKGIILGDSVTQFQIIQSIQSFIEVSTGQ